MSLQPPTTERPRARAATMPVVRAARSVSAAGRASSAGHVTAARLASSGHRGRGVVLAGLALLAMSSTPLRAMASGPRLVSLNPSLTAIVERLGAGGTLVGIDDYSARILPALASRPRVGGLFDPNLEAILALKPDHVLLVAGLEQEAHGKALRRLGLDVEVFENERFDEVLANIERLGALLGREQAARERIDAIRATRAAVEGATRGLPRPRTVIVLDRSPLYLVGGETFLDELLRAVGATNVGAEVGRGYPRGSLEWLVAAAPSLLLDLSPQAEDDVAGESEGALGFWKRWPSLPAVGTGRVLALDATRISLPGPDLDRALRELAVAVHGAGIEAAIERALEREREPERALERGREPARARGVEGAESVQP